MVTGTVRNRVAFVVVTSIALWIDLPRFAQAHCDTMDGPVVKTAKAALERGDVTPVLKWVKKADEQQIRDAFRKTLAVRAKGGQARELADQYFLETLVRIHRQGEGAPYTGLKPAGTEIGPAVRGADAALESGSVDDLVKIVTEQVAAGIRARFREAFEKHKHADDNIDAGRDFVDSYVEFTHYTERLYEDAMSHAGHHEAEASVAANAAHAHQ